MKGAKIYDGFVYAYVTVLKASSTKEDLKYADGYIDPNTFQWETEAHISDKNLTDLKNSKGILIFVRKVDNEDGIQLPFTYIGTGHMEYIEGSKKQMVRIFSVFLWITLHRKIYILILNCQGIGEIITDNVRAICTYCSLKTYYSFSISIFVFQSDKFSGIFRVSMTLLSLPEINDNLIGSPSLESFINWSILSKSSI